MEHILSMGWGIEAEHIAEIQNNVWQVYTDCGIFALKRSLLKKKHLDFICTAEHSLPQHGFYQFALPVPCLDGKPYLLYYGRYFTLHQWISGEKCDFQNTDHLYLAASTLGDFHLRSREPDLCTMASPRSNSFVRGENETKHLRELYRFYRASKEMPPSEFSDLFRSYYPYFIQKAERSLSLLHDSHYPRLAMEAAAVGSFIHYDVAARNFIIQNNGAYLIDFDYCCCDLPLTDLMRLIKRGLKQGKKEWEKLDAMLKGYQQFRPLTAEETKVLIALLTFPQKFWRISHRYFCGELAHDEDFCIKKLRLAMEESLREDQWLPMLKEKTEEAH
ncbi:MAG: CotS family spore coat protein [Firmicutes bacterium]|nr:CotS family spore coat protein [Bacillota bacterium]